MKRSVILLLTLVSFCCCKTYSQSIVTPPLSEINQALAEGLEAKELLKKRSVSLHKADSLILGFKTSEELMHNENRILLQNNGILEAQKAELKVELDKSNKEKEKQKGHKIFWRGTAICTSIVSVLLAIIVFL